MPSWARIGKPSWLKVGPLISPHGGLTMPYKVIVVAVMALVSCGTLVTFGTAGAETTLRNSVSAVLPGTTEAAPRSEGQIIAPALLNPDDLLSTMNLQDFTPTSGGLLDLDDLGSCDDSDSDSSDSSDSDSSDSDSSDSDSSDSDSSDSDSSDSDSSDSDSDGCYEFEDSTATPTPTPTPTTPGASATPTPTPTPTPTETTAPPPSVCLSLGTRKLC